MKLLLLRWRKVEIIMLLFPSLEIWAQQKDPGLMKVMRNWEIMYHKSLLRVPKVERRFLWYLLCFYFSITRLLSEFRTSEPEQTGRFPYLQILILVLHFYETIHIGFTFFLDKWILRLQNPDCFKSKNLAHIFYIKKRQITNGRRRWNMALPVHIASFAAGYLVAHITEHEYPRAAPIPLDAVEFAASLNAHFTWQLDVVPHQTRQVFELLHTCNQEEKAIKTSVSITHRKENQVFFFSNEQQ